MMRIRTRRQRPLAFAALVIVALAASSIDCTPLFCRAQELGQDDDGLPGTQGETSTVKNESLDTLEETADYDSGSLLVENSTGDKAAITTSTISEKEAQEDKEGDTAEGKERNQSDVDDDGESSDKDEKVKAQQTAPTIASKDEKNSSLPPAEVDSSNDSTESSKGDDSEAKGKDPESTKSEEADSSSSKTGTTEEAKESFRVSSGEAIPSSEEPDDNTTEHVSQQQQQQEATDTDTATDNPIEADVATDNTSTAETENFIESEAETAEALDDKNATQPDAASSNDSTTTNDTKGTDLEQDKSTGAPEEPAEASSLPTNDSKVEEKSPEKHTSSASTEPADQDYFDLDEDDATTVTGSSTTDQNPASASDDNSATTSTPPSDSKVMKKDSKAASATEEESIVADEKTRTTKGEDIKKPPKEGSLANFMQKVKGQEEQNLSGNPRDAVKDKEATKEPTTATTDDSTLPSNEGTSDPSSTSTTTSASIPYQPWGQFTGKRYADLHILGLTFNKNLAGEAATRYRKLFEPLDLVIPTLYTKIMGNAGATASSGGSKATGKPDPITDSIAPPLKERLSSPNADWEGLDDIDKFFEEVDPPDELDVGAGGTSIQDVLMGQTTKIVIKRVVLGAQYVARTGKAAAKRIHQYFANNDDDDGGGGEQKPKESKFPKLQKLKLNKEQLTKAGKWTVEQGKTLWAAAREFFDDLFGGEDELEGGEFASYANDLQRRLQEMKGEEK